MSLSISFCIQFLLWFIFDDQQTVLIMDVLVTKALV